MPHGGRYFHSVAMKVKSVAMWPADNRGVEISEVLLTTFFQQTVRCSMWIITGSGLTGDVEE